MSGFPRRTGLRLPNAFPFGIRRPVATFDVAVRRSFRRPVEPPRRTPRSRGLCSAPLLVSPPRIRAHSRNPIDPRFYPAPMALGPGSRTLHQLHWRLIHPTSSGRIGGPPGTAVDSTGRARAQRRFAEFAGSGRTNRGQRPRPRFPGLYQRSGQCATGRPEWCRRGPLGRPRDPLPRRSRRPDRRGVGNLFVTFVDGPVQAVRPDGSPSATGKTRVRSVHIDLEFRRTGPAPGNRR